MKITNPNIKVIEKALDNHYKLRYRLYSLIWSYMYAAESSEGMTTDKAHKLIDELLNNHGVESFRVKVRGQVRTLYYSNAGDTYTPTVMRWDWIDGGQRRVIWLVGCWGDIAEKYPEVRQ